jgi:hypothetical protein
LNKWTLAGLLTELFHICFTFGVLVFGKLWLPESIILISVGLTVIGQIIFLWCPLSVLSTYCFRKGDPNYNHSPSITLNLYRKHGRKAAIPIVIIWLTVMFIIGKLTGL